MTINRMQASKFANIVLTGPYNHETNKGIKVFQDCLNWVFFMTNFVVGSNSFIKKRSLWDKIFIPCELL
jgi:hypothetical protein